MQTKFPQPQSPYGMQALIVLVSSVFAYVVFRLNKSLGLAVGLVGIVIAIQYKTHYQNAVDKYIDPIIEGLDSLHLKHVNWIRDNIDMNKSYSQEEVEKELDRLETIYDKTQHSKDDSKIEELALDWLHPKEDETVWPETRIAKVDDSYLRDKLGELTLMAHRFTSGTTKDPLAKTVSVDKEGFDAFLDLVRPVHSSYVCPVLVNNRLIRIESWDD